VGGIASWAGQEIGKQRSFGEELYGSYIRNDSRSEEEDVLIRVKSKM
jgi:hypothetical protein